ncbi:MAG TPA: glutamine amidotransferase, partial [Pirellulales bacterium]|nr:glutamine amidotransferase [Pirellulales bacterium]
MKHLLLSTIELENVRHGWLWLVLLAAGLLLLLATYRGIYQRSHERLAWWLMALRVAGLTALVVALARPAWTRVSQLIDPGRVALVLDDSLSMSLADAGGQPRYALAKSAVEELRQGIAARPGDDAMAVDCFDIAGKPLGDHLPDQPRAERTELVSAVRQAVAQLRSKPLAGVVLISDGADNTGTDETQELAELTVPLYTVGFQPDVDSSRLDLAVRTVKAPRRVIVNNEIKVEVLVVKTAGPAVEATVSIRRGDSELARQRVALPAGPTEQVVSVPLKPAEPGTFIYKAAVATDAGERLAANNARFFPLQVDADAIKVLYLEGFLRYEYKFLKARLGDDPDVRLAAIVRRANPDQVDSSSQGSLLTPDRLKEFEVVILGDMEASFLTDAEYRALVEWIEAGHSLLVLGGYRSFGPQGFRGTPLADSLPVVFTEGPVVQSEDPFVLALTEQGRQHPIFQITGDRVKDAAMWSTSPHLLGSSVVERAKPGADVLAVNPSFVQNGQPAAVVAAQRYGKGHTLVIAADTTWRWSRLPRLAGQSDTLYAKFWSQTIRWLAGREITERPPLVVSTSRPDYEVGKPVEVRLLRQPGEDAKLAEAEPHVEIRNESGKTFALPVHANSAEPDTFLGIWHAQAGGRYRVEAALVAAGQTLANQGAEFLVHGSDLELADTGTDPDRLRAMAKLTGG